MSQYKDIKMQSKKEIREMEKELGLPKDYFQTPKPKKSGL